MKIQFENENNCTEKTIKITKIENGGLKKWESN
jgi:hypothetical protein